MSSRCSRSRVCRSSRTPTRSWPRASRPTSKRQREVTTESTGVEQAEPELDQPAEPDPAQPQPRETAPPNRNPGAAPSARASDRNPLRDARDRRLPRVPAPCALVVFGVTGDLARKKLLPAIYDLANRGLLPA